MRKIDIYFKMISGVFLFALLLCINPTEVQAKEQYISNRPIDVKQKVNGITFVSRQYQVQAQYKCKIVMVKNGKKTIIAKDTSAEFVTNGKILYYVHRGDRVDDYSCYNTIYKYDINSGNKTEITSGTDYTVMGATSQFLYMGRDYGADGVELYAYNLKTGKQRHMKDYVGSIFIKKNRVITEDNTGAIANLAICSFKPNGTDKKKIADGEVRKVTQNKIYYVVYDFRSLEYRYKKYICSLTGKNKKAISKWIPLVW